MPLSDTACRNRKAAPKPYKLVDGHGLYLEVRPTGAKLWRYRYRIAGRENLYALGEFAVAPAGETAEEAYRRRQGGRFTLQEARQVRQSARALVKQGRHPSHVRAAAKADQIEANANTFAVVAGEWLNAKSAGWASGRLTQIERILKADVFPYIGNLPIDAISAPQMIEVIDRVVGRGAPTIARIAWNVSVKVFAFAKKRGQIKSSPISDIEDVIPQRRVKHRSPLAKGDIPAFVKAIRGYTGLRQTRIALELLMLTFVRGSELLGATWGEFDLDGGEWRIPSHRMKMRELHIVPLSTQAVALLRELKTSTGAKTYAFPNQQRRQACMSRSTLNAALTDLGYGGKFSPHGFRATASTMLNEIGYRPDIIERQLAHKQRDQVSAAYNQAQHLDARREMMQGWADVLQELAKGDSSVIPGKFQKAA